jgi:hypothetical protein
MTAKNIFQKPLATSLRWVNLALPNENWALGGCGDKSNRMQSPHPPALFWHGWEIQLAPHWPVVRFISQFPPPAAAVFLFLT